MSSSSVHRGPFQVNKVIEMTRKAQRHYNRGLIEMAKQNYEESQEDLYKCMRLRLYIRGPLDYRVAIVHEAIADLKFRMLNDVTCSESSCELKQAATMHYLAALRPAAYEQLDHVQREEAMEFFMKNVEEDKKNDNSTRSVENILKKAERMVANMKANMKLKSSGHLVDDITEESREKEEEIENMVKRVLINLRHLDVS